MDCEPCQSCLSCSHLKTQCPMKNLSYSQCSLNICDTKGFHSWGSFLRGTFPSCWWVLARENCAISILSSLHESEAQWVFVEWLNNWIAEWVMEERDKWLWGKKQCEEETGQLHTLPKFLLGAGCFGGTQEAKICFLSWVKHDNPPYQESCNAILWKSATQWGSVIHWKDYFRENGIKACKRCCPRQVRGNYGN